MNSISSHKCSYEEKELQSYKYTQTYQIKQQNDTKNFIWVTNNIHVQII